jgi:RNA polymerase sigma factor (TIGR02999 family)
MTNFGITEFYHVEANEMTLIPDRDPSESRAEITRILQTSTSGDPEALGKLTPRVYKELRRMANHFLKNERAGYTLQSTELVHEVYLRLVDVNEVAWQDKAHFFALSATLMRRILLDRARRRLAVKRGNKPKLVDLDEALDVSVKKAREVIALDDALGALAQLDPRKARTIELRFFAGLSVKETAEVLNVSQETVMRDWKFSRAWLLAELGSLPEAPS